jgi:hypothetical protein
MMVDKKLQGGKNICFHMDLDDRSSIWFYWQRLNHPNEEN